MKGSIEDMDTYNRIPPYNLEAEQSVLGAMLLDKDAVSTAAEILKKEDFYRENHREIFEAIMSLFDQAQPIDIITVSEKLNLKDVLESVGGLDYLSYIVNQVPTTANTRYYSKIVEEKSVLRKLIKASSEIMNLSYHANEEVASILDIAEKSVFDILQKRNLQGVLPVKDVLIDAFNRLEEIYNNKGAITGLPTGFLDLDNKTAGLQKSDLILIAARPAMGKTAFAMNIGQYVAIKKKVPVAIFSLEMSAEQLVNRLMCSEAMVDNQKMKTGKLEDDDWKKFARAMGPMSEAPIFIDDTPGITATDIRAKCRRLKLEKGLGLIIIDYLQLVEGRGRRENRQQEITDISRSLKILAKEIDVPVITLSQLSRAPEQRADHRPILSDLRESGAIEQDADLVMFLYRDDYYDPDSEKKNIAEVIIAKSRHGSTGSIELGWMGEFTKFVNLKYS